MRKTAHEFTRVVDAVCVVGKSGDIKNLSPQLKDLVSLVSACATLKVRGAFQLAEWGHRKGW
jgi:hypothetical protein